MYLLLMFSLFRLFVFQMFRLSTECLSFWKSRMLLVFLEVDFVFQFHLLVQGNSWQSGKTWQTGELLWANHFKIFINVWEFHKLTIFHSFYTLMWSWLVSHVRDPIDWWKGFAVALLPLCWRHCVCLFVWRSDRLLREVTICLVGKYTRLEDAYASVIKALNHAAMACNLKLDLKVTWQLLN